MKKLSFLTMIVLGATMVMISSPSKGYAIMTAMTEAGMREATAQAGIAITAADKIAMEMEIKSIAYGDTDGIDGNGAYLSLNDVSFNAVIAFKDPVSIAVTTKMDPYQNTMLTGIDISMTGMTIDMDRFDIGSITVGSAPGEGKSFGSFSMRDFHSTISGNVRITSH
jgi:hypothetical protein